MTSSRKAGGPDRTQSVMERVLTTVAEHEQCDVLDLPPLAYVVDPDALTRLIQGAGVRTVSFAYHDYCVSIDSDGRVQVTPA